MAEINYSLPISQNLPQTFTKIINGRVIKVAIQYNKALDNWFLYFAELVDDTENVLVSGLSLVTGVNLIAQFPHKNIGIDFFVYHREPGIEFDYPQATTLNSKFVYIWKHE